LWKSRCQGGFFIVTSSCFIDARIRVAKFDCDGEALMKHNELETMSINELWNLYENIASTLAKRIEDEIDKLQDRLDKLGRKLALPALAEAPQRRPYPKVFPKFQNPERPSETWTGRGKQPHWVSDLLQAGGSMDDIRISHTLEAAP
jgi:DNA-binding protein H-NS